MIVVDASVWLSSLIEQDANHRSTIRWQNSWPVDGFEIHVPGIAIVEIGGGVARRTNSDAAGYHAVQAVIDHPSVRVQEMTTELIMKSAALAIELRLRGADSTYVALANLMNAPLVTWDREQRERASRVISSFTPRDFD